MRISDLSSDVCSSDLDKEPISFFLRHAELVLASMACSLVRRCTRRKRGPWTLKQVGAYRFRIRHPVIASGAKQSRVRANRSGLLRSARNDEVRRLTDAKGLIAKQVQGDANREVRSEEHTSELQSLIRISYADFC